MTQGEFERILADAAAKLTEVVRTDSTHHGSGAFETLVRKTLVSYFPANTIDFAPHPHVFPDIVIGQFGIEVKVTNKDSWRTVANSVFESRRSGKVLHIYVLYGKMGGVPEVRCGRYDDCVMHVRTSHVPRFEVDLETSSSLFSKFGITYTDFSALSPADKMRYIRAYARGRLRPGERLWWLEDEDVEERAFQPEVRLFMHLTQELKRQYRAEAALLCPQIVKGSRSRNKYNEPVMYLLVHHGVLCPQARDLFSAGSVALRASSARGGLYIKRALLDIEEEMREAAQRLPDALFGEYWGRTVAPNRRIAEWLKMADAFATNWKPSQSLFVLRRSDVRER